MLRERDAFVLLIGAVRGQHLSVSRFATASVLSDSGLMGPGAAAQPCRREFVYILVTYTRLTRGLCANHSSRPHSGTPTSPPRGPRGRDDSRTEPPVVRPRNERAASGPGGSSETLSQLRPRRRLARTPAGEGVLQRLIRRGGRQRRVGVGLAVLGALAPPFIRCDGHAAQVRSKASLPSPRNPTRLDEGSRQLQERRRIGRGGASRGGDGTL